MSGRFECVVVPTIRNQAYHPYLDYLESNGSIRWNRVRSIVGQHAKQHATYVSCTQDLGLIRDHCLLHMCLPRRVLNQRCTRLKYKFVGEWTLNGTAVYVYKHVNADFGIVIREVEDMCLLLDFCKGDCSDEATLTKFAAKDIDEQSVQCVDCIDFPHEDSGTITVHTVTQRVLANAIQSGRLSEHSRIVLWGLGRNRLYHNKVLKKAKQKNTNRRSNAQVQREC